MKELNVAVVVEDLVGFGGADRLLKSVLEIYPNATVYTSKINRKEYSWLKNEVITTFLDIPILRNTLFKFTQPFKPLAYEMLDLSGHDLVISISPFAAHGVITGIYQPHISIILTPSRMLWDSEFNVRAKPFAWVYRFLGKIVTHYQRIWASTAIHRVDHLVSISSYIQRKLKKVHRKDSMIVYPGITKSWFEPNTEDFRRQNSIYGEYFIAVARLWDYKRIDMAIRACGEAGEQLVVVGEGPDRRYLEKLAKPYENIHFLGWIDDTSLKSAYADAQALLFCGIEDFGLIPVEAMATGTPVIAYNDGGVLDTVVDGTSGVLFNTEDELLDIISSFDKKNYKKSEIINQAKKFTQEKFKTKFKKEVEKVWQERKR